MRLPSALPALAISLLTASLAPPAPVSAQGLFLLPGVEEIESDSIPDLAIAAVDQPRPAVYWNPVLARRYGPLITRFFIAHEYGHLHHRHTRAGHRGLPAAIRDSLLRAQELEADCYAASRPGAEARAATEAVLQYFTRLAPFRFDAEHPTGAQRAGEILRCLPPPAPPARSVMGDTGAAPGPVSGAPERVRFDIEAPLLRERGPGATVVLWLDGQRVGRVSNLEISRVLRVEQLGAGWHTCRVELEAWGFCREGSPMPDGSTGGRGELLVREGDRFQVVWAPGTAPALIPVRGREPAGP